MQRERAASGQRGETTSNAHADGDWLEANFHALRSPRQRGIRMPSRTTTTVLDGVRSSG